MHKPASVAIRRLTTGFLRLSALIAALAVGCDQREPGNAGNPVPVDTIARPAGVEREAAGGGELVGVWARTDGPYQIEITEALEDGRLDAGYYNPGPINVGRAEWARSAEGVTVYLELRDERYPGSNYALTYRPAVDELAGTYFQAVEGVTYEVAFTRIR